MGSCISRCRDSCEECFLRDKVELTRVQQEMLLLQNAVRECERNLKLGCC